MNSMMRFSAGFESRYTTSSVAPAVSFGEEVPPLRATTTTAAMAATTTIATITQGHLRRLSMVKPCGSAPSRTVTDSSMLMSAGVWSSRRAAPMVWLTMASIALIHVDRNGFGTTAGLRWFDPNGDDPCAPHP
jgi:hypothetical protein